MPRPKKSASTKTKRTYKKKTSKPKRKYTRKSSYSRGYTKSRDPQYAASSRQMVGATRSQRVPVPTHFTETIPLGSPNKNHWRALVMSPAHIMGLLAKYPQLGKYSQCRIPDFQVGDSVLIPAVSKGSFLVGAAGSVTGYVYPSLEYMADTFIPTVGLPAAIFGTPTGVPPAGLTRFINNRAYADVWAAGALARCVGYCVEIKGLDSATNLSGRIGLVNLPSDPFNKLAASTIDDLANQPSAITALSKTGCHLAWIPDANVTTPKYYHLMTNGVPDVYDGASGGGLVSDYTWRYQQFMPNGLRSDGLKATTMVISDNPPATNAFEIGRTHVNSNNISFKTGTTPVVGSSTGLRVMDMLPVIMFVINGSNPVNTSGSYMFNVYSHWEVIPDTRGKLSEPGALGQHASGGEGLLNKAEHVVTTVIHDVESAASTVIHTGEKVASIIGTGAKVAAEIGSVLAMVGI